MPSLFEKIVSIAILIGIGIVAVIIGTFVLKLVLGLLVIAGVVYVLKRNNVF